MTTKNKPLVSVIMPVRNAGLFLMEAIQSIQDQTYKNWELIAVDDCSTDNSMQILRYFAKRDKRIKVFKNDSNGGVSVTANKALKKAKGDFIARMDADDISLPTRLEKQIAFLKMNKDVVLVGAQCELINETGKKVGEKHFPLDYKKVKAMIFSSIPVQQPSLMINRKLLPQNFSWYDNGFTVAEEVGLLFRLFNFGKVSNLPDILLKYRIHSKNTSLVNPKKTFYSTFKTRIKAIYKYDYRPTVKGIIITLAEVFIVTLLPNRMVYPLYTVVRGLKEKRLSISVRPQLAKLGW